MTTLYYGIHGTTLNIGGTSTTNCDISFIDTDIVSDITRPGHSNASIITVVNFINSLAPNIMAYGFYDFDNLTTINNMSNLDTSNVTDMSYMFYSCSGSSFNPDVSNGDVSNVTNMDSMFSSCGSFFNPNLSNGDVSNVTNMRYMFMNCRGHFNPDFSNGNVSSVTNMYGMFYNCNGHLFNPDVSNGNVSSVTDMNGMFCYCSGDSFNPDVSNGDVSSVTDMSFMFRNCSSAVFNPDVSNGNVSSVTNMSGIFMYCDGNSFTSINLSSGNVSNQTDIHNMFYNCDKLTTILVASNTDGSSRNGSSSNVFFGCLSLVGQHGTVYNSSHVDASYAKVDNLNGEPGYFTSINVLFYKIEGTTLNISNSNNTNYNAFDPNIVALSDRPGHSAIESITTVNFINSLSPSSTAGGFWGATNLTTINNLNNLDTSNITNMAGMFAGCSNLSPLNISNGDVSKVTNMSNMFSGASIGGTLNLSNGDTFNVTNMRGMFSYCVSLRTLDLTGGDTSNVIDMVSMFNGCYNLQTIYVSNAGTTSNLIESGEMFNNCSSLIGQKGTTCIYPNLTETYARLDNPPTFPGYFSMKPTVGNAYAIFNEIDTLTFFRSENEYNASNETQTVEDVNGNEYNGIVYVDIENLNMTLSTDIGTDIRSFITTVTFPENQIIVPESMAYGFNNCINLTTINNLKSLQSPITGSSSTAYMFANCQNIQTINGNSEIIKINGRCSHMFDNCLSLEEINILNMMLPLVVSSLDENEFDDIFINCNSLKKITIGDGFYFRDNMNFPVEPNEISEEIKTTGKGGRTKDSSGQIISDIVYHTVDELIENYPSSVDESYGAGTYEPQKQYRISYKINNEIIETEGAIENSIITFENEREFPINLIAYGPGQETPEDELDYLISSTQYVGYFNYSINNTPISDTITVLEPLIIDITQDTSDVTLIPNYPNQPSQSDVGLNHAMFLGGNDTKSTQGTQAANAEGGELTSNILYAIYEIMELAMQEKVRNPEKLAHPDNENLDDGVVLHNVYKDSEGNMYPEGTGSINGGGSGSSIKDVGAANSGIYIENGEAKQVNYSIDYEENNEDKFLTIVVKDDLQQDQTIKIPYPESGDSLELPQPDNDTIKIINGKGTAEVTPGSSGTDNLSTITQKNAGDNINVISSITIGQDGNLQSATVSKIKLPQSPIVATTVTPTAAGTLIGIDIS